VGVFIIVGTVTFWKRGLPESIEGSVIWKGMLIISDFVGYGPIVRTAPDEVHVSDPKTIPIIYPTQQPLEKTD
jgi:hypothetical protein